jgi:hypothetical protein
LSALVQTGPGAHPASCSGYRVFPGGRKRPGRDADPSPLSSAEVSYNPNSAARIIHLVSSAAVYPRNTRRGQENRGMKPEIENVKRQLSGSLKPSARILGERHFSGGETRTGNCEVSPRAIWLVAKPPMRQNKRKSRSCSSQTLGSSP